MGTETDDRSFDYARRNVSRNGLGDRIEIFRAEDSEKDGPIVAESVLDRFNRYVY